MQQRIRTLAIGLLAWLTACQAWALDDGAIARFEHPAWFKASFHDLRDDLADAADAGRRGVLLFFSTQGCAYCHLMLKTTLAEPGFVERLRADFDVIGLEIFDDAEITDWQGRTLRIKRFARREGAEFSPTLAFYDLEGRQRLRLVGYYGRARLEQALDYLADPAAGGQSFDAWLARQPDDVPAPEPGPGLQPDPLFEAPPYQLDRSRFRAERPLLVIFERRGCAECRVFHREVLDDPEVRRALAGFEVVRLDGDDDRTPVVDPAGTATTAAAWMDRLGLGRAPALALFDEAGRLALDTDATVFKRRFLNALGYVRAGAHEKGWTYQRHARHENIQRLLDADEQKH